MSDTPLKQREKLAERATEKLVRAQRLLEEAYALADDAGDPYAVGAIDSLLAALHPIAVSAQESK